MKKIVILLLLVTISLTSSAYSIDSKVSTIVQDTSLSSNVHNTVQTFDDLMQKYWPDIKEKIGHSIQYSQEAVSKVYPMLLQYFRFKHFFWLFVSIGAFGAGVKAIQIGIMKNRSGYYDQSGDVYLILGVPSVIVGFIITLYNLFYVLMSYIAEEIFVISKVMGLVNSC